MAVENRRDILLFGKPTFQNTALSDYLNSATRRSCRIVEHIPSTMNQGRHLLLVDVLDEFPIKTLSRLEKAAQLTDAALVGLLNARPDAYRPELLEFPFLTGIFGLHADAAQLVRGIEAIFQGELWLPRHLLSAYLEKTRRRGYRESPALATLTDKEKQILRLLAAGYTNAAIASQLFVSVHTIKTHIYHLFRKIQVNNRTQATNWAIRHLASDGFDECEKGPLGPGNHAPGSQIHMGRKIA